MQRFPALPVIQRPPQRQRNEHRGEHAKFDRMERAAGDPQETAPLLEGLVSAVVLETKHDIPGSTPWDQSGLQTESAATTLQNTAPRRRARTRTIAASMVLIVSVVTRMIPDEAAIRSIHRSALARVVSVEGALIPTYMAA